MPPKKHLGYTSSTSVENGRNYTAGVGGQSSMNRGLKKTPSCVSCVLIGNLLKGCLNIVEFVSNKTCSFHPVGILAACSRVRPKSWKILGQWMDVANDFQQ